MSCDVEQKPNTPRWARRAALGGGQERSQLLRVPPTRWTEVSGSLTPSSYGKLFSFPPPVDHNMPTRLAPASALRPPRPRGVPSPSPPPRRLAQKIGRHPETLSTKLPCKSRTRRRRTRDVNGRAAPGTRRAKSSAPTAEEKSAETVET